MELILIWGLFGIGSAVVASSKNRSGCGWFIIGVLLGPIGFLISIGISKVEERDPHAPHPSTHLKCPDCREFVLKDAKVCKHCGCKLTPQA